MKLYLLQYGVRSYRRHAENYTEARKQAVALFNPPAKYRSRVHVTDITSYKPFERKA